MTRVALAVAISTMLAACGAPAANTPSGRPETTVTGTVDQVSAKITGAMVNRGYMAKSASGSLLIFEKPAPNNAGNLWVGASVGPLTHRVNFTVINDASGGVRVVTDASVISWAGAPREQVLPGLGQPPAAVADAQAVLAGLR